MKTIAKMMCVAVALVVSCGCAMGSGVKTRLTETVLDEDGNPVTMEYEAKSKAGLLGELDLSVHTLDYAWSNADDGVNRIQVGQSSEGISNAGQVAVVDMVAGLGASIGSMIAGVITDLIASGLLIPAVPADP